MGHWGDVWRAHLHHGPDHQRHGLVRTGAVSAGFGGEHFARRRAGGVGGSGAQTGRHAWQQERVAAGSVLLRPRRGVHGLGAYFAFPGTRAFHVRTRNRFCHARGAHVHRGDVAALGARATHLTQRMPHRWWYFTWVSRKLHHQWGGGRVAHPAVQLACIFCHSRSGHVDAPGFAALVVAAGQANGGGEGRPEQSTRQKGGA
mmetsp:Transcript_6586/g.16356  ORF Transcript_6586/g.16356 Transcript_6586/m.16356 type:complete len:202 (-) Transcript_6586:1452-2057(-)